MPVLHNPAGPASLKAKFTLQNLLVNDGVVSSRSAESRRAIAQKWGSPIGFSSVA
jgi:hypothetical protein